MEEERESESARKREAFLRHQLSRVKREGEAVNDYVGPGDVSACAQAFNLSPAAVASATHEPCHGAEGSDWQMTPEAHMRRGGVHGG